MMKIALCLEYPIGLRGGVSVLVETLLRELIRHGHEVVLVSPDDPAGLRQSELGSLIREHVHWDPSRRPSIANARKLARQLAEARVDLAHFHFGGIYGWCNRHPWHCPVFFLDRLGVPCVSTVHLVVSMLYGYCDSHKPVWFKVLRLPPAWWGKMQQLRHVRREIAVSQHDFQILRRWYRPLRNRFTQIYHSRLQIEAAPVPPAKREPVILNVGHIAWRKGQAVLAEAFARIAPRHPGWTLQLAGTDADGVALEQILRITREQQLDGRILLLGERNDTVQLMNQAAVFVQPSFNEGLPLALQEALYNGCACVATRIPGNIELIEHEFNGLLVPPGSPEELSRALDRLLGEKGLRDRLAANGPASILKKEMTAAQMTRKHLELYATVLTEA
jgi:glycosyltransferase involved in cell wall biosynthesis